MEITEKKSLWNLAGTAGLIMGLISTAAMFAGQYCATLNMSDFLTLFTGTILWIAETVGCILTMWFFMKKFAAECPSADSRTISRMGLTTAFLSALVYSAASFANIAFISADFYEAQYQIIMQQMSPMMDSNSKELMMKMIGYMPQITFFSNLIYCSIFGTIVSSVISRLIPKEQ